MITLETLFLMCGVAIAATPYLLVAISGVASLVDRPLAERTSSLAVGLVVANGLLAACGILIVMTVRNDWHLTIELGHWVSIPDYAFAFKLLFDPLSLSFVILTYILCGTIGAFANRYLHREPGYNRFYFLYAVFMAGMVTSALAGTIETLFTGWELVGLSSTLLVAFFHERTMPVRNGLRVWSVYRIADAAFLVAAIALHHMRGHGDFDALLGTGAWPAGQSPLSGYQALVVGSLLLVAAAGKSALIPFSGWLPRAMEGPTPSSAIFYGALSVHLGAYLLLRTSAIISLSPLLCTAIVVLGLATAVLAALMARAQTDIKSALSFAALTQVGIIVAEIGLGLYWIALLHLLGHACLRTLQFLRAPSLLQDYRQLENAMGESIALRNMGGRLPIPAAVGPWLYRLAIERGYLDAVLNDYIVAPFLGVFRFCDRQERAWTNWLAGKASRESDRLPPSAGSIEELS